jgi:hypothetical protein
MLLLTDAAPILTRTGAAAAASAANGAQSSNIKNGIDRSLVIQRHPSGGSRCIIFDNRRQIQDGSVPRRQRRKGVYSRKGAKHAKFGFDVISTEGRNLFFRSLTSVRDDGHRPVTFAALASLRETIRD